MRETITPYHTGEPLWPADVVHVRHLNWFGRRTLHAERQPGEPPAWATHTAMVVGCLQGGDGTPIVVEAKARVRVHPITALDPLRCDWIITRPPDSILVPIDCPRDGRHSKAALMRQRIAEHVLTRAGDHYGWWKIPAIALDLYLFRGRNIARRFFFLDSRPVCSWLIGEAFQKQAMYRFGNKHYKFADPDDIADDVTRNGWQIVAASSREALESWAEAQGKRIFARNG